MRRHATQALDGLAAELFATAPPAWKGCALVMTSRGAATQCHASPPRHAAARMISARLRVNTGLWRAGRRCQIISQGRRSLKLHGRAVHQTSLTGCRIVQLGVRRCLQTLHYSHRGKERTP